MSNNNAVLEVEAAVADQLSVPRVPLCAGFVCAGTLAGSVLGIFEAALLYTRPPYSVVARPDISLLIFLAAPLADLLVFGFLGLILGYIAKKGTAAGKSYVRWLWSVGFGAAGAFVTGTVSLRFWWDKYPSLSLLAFVVIAGGVSVATLLATLLRKWERRRGGFSPYEGAQWIHRLRIGALAIGVMLFGSAAAYEARALGSIPAPPAYTSGFAGRPNIILITLDAATANHFSCYGYSRETTPTVDRLAKRGVQFDNAIAPSSWTLPSFASIFTGLFPHQHGADFAHPLPDRFPTIAMALKSAGYQTAGFNANWAYGQTRQGIARGFDLYKDGSENLRQNLTQTLFGRAFTKFVYLRLARPDRPERQSAEEINREVFRWFSYRTQQPYFLLINYFDVHSPYFAPRPFTDRYGKLSYELVRRFNSEIPGVEGAVLAPEEQALMVAGYDNSLAYTDRQIEVLMQFLAKSPDWSNTVVIITADHGESLGEHGQFGHGWGLSRELVHVPLIILGPGVPAGIHIQSVVGTRSLHNTILGFAKGSKEGAPARSSLQGYWSGNQNSIPTSPAVVSEIDFPANPRSQDSYISVTTPQWHWILDARGHTQLFDWVNDPQEKTDLSGSTGANTVGNNLQQVLRNRVMGSPRPWEGLRYLHPLGLGGGPPANAPDREAFQSLPYQ